MKRTIYIETSVISYRVARPSRDIIVLARQEITAEWWDTVLPHLDAYVSPVVLDEIAGGDQQAQALRLQLVANMAPLAVDERIISLAEAICEEIRFPERAQADAYHIAIPSVHGIDYLVTWNCKHIANAFMLRKIEQIVQAKGYTMPVVCTPEELMEEIQDERSDS
jgi:predicted nucleic acid-binding protein